MPELTPEARAEIQAAVAIVRSDKTGHINRESLRAILNEELDKRQAPKPADPPKPDGPTPPPPTPPKPADPAPEEPKRRRIGYWPDQEDS